ncbi:MAG: OmpA family protein [Spirochaetia bacterium]|nr:OmpA family protein [Spirochaetota bacterium]MCX8096769.1 OmpA family protein [Spirochaetota bacterium]MDW8112543.1 OmpA family protein [Spirochaetia bacterium]
MVRLLFIINALVALLSISILSHSYEFYWKLNTNEILRVKSFVRQNIYTNNSFAKYVEIINKSSVDVKGKSTANDKTYYNVDGIYYVFSKDYLKDKEFKLEEIHNSRYLLEDTGRMIISKEYLMPVSRDIPVFISRKLKIGDEWFHKGREVHKIGFSQLYDIVEIEFNTYYKFLYTTNVDNKELAVFEIKYGFANTFPRARVIRYLSGSSQMKYYWDINAGKPSFVTEEYFFNAIYDNGMSVIYSGSSEGYLEVVNKWKEDNRREIISKIQETLKDQKGVSISTNENEINISIPDIVFDFNSYKVKEEFKLVLSNLSQKISNHKEIDMIVEGHTDDIGSDEYNQKLSEARAREVAKILTEFGISPDRVSYIGYGKRKPKFPNTSSENRAKNRRVEIKLLWGR